MQAGSFIFLLHQGQAEGVSGDYRGSGTQHQRQFSKSWMCAGDTIRATGYMLEQRHQQGVLRHVWGLSELSIGKG